MPEFTGEINLDFKVCMLYHVIYINEIAAVMGLGYFIKVFAARLRPENPFTDSMTICLGVFHFIQFAEAGRSLLDLLLGLRDVTPASAIKIALCKKCKMLHKMYSFNRSFLYSLRVDKRTEDQIERVREFSPEMDFNLR